MLAPGMGWDKSVRLVSEQGNAAVKHILDCIMQPLGAPARSAGAEQRIATCMESYML